MIKFGIEKEVFLRKDGKFVNVPTGYPMDECGWLLELRTKASNNIQEVIDDLLLLEFKYYRELEGKGYEIVQTPLAEISKEVVRKAIIDHGKPAPSYSNYLGHDFHNNKQSEKTASIHISITDQEEIKIPVSDYELYLRSTDGKIEVKKIDRDPQVRIVNKALDYMKYFLALDKQFAKEIKDSSRAPGMYEFKIDGRIEYRSLPNNIDLYKLVRVIKSI